MHSTHHQLSRETSMFLSSFLFLPSPREKISLSILFQIPVWKWNHSLLLLCFHSSFPFASKSFSFEKCIHSLSCQSSEEMNKDTGRYESDGKRSAVTQCAFILLQKLNYHHRLERHGMKVHLSVQTPVQLVFAKAVLTVFSSLFAQGISTWLLFILIICIRCNAACIVLLCLSRCHFEGKGSREKIVGNNKKRTRETDMPFHAVYFEIWYLYLETYISVQ